MRAYCYNCGSDTDYNHVYPVDEQLIKTWELSPRLAALFNEREGLICVECGVNKRAQGLAQAILASKYGYGQKSLRDWVRVANEKGLKVCELNSCHNLHETLKDLKGLTYSEFGTPTEQNIEALTYDDGSFDIVLHSETLEHVSDPRKAMDECRRVLKSDGVVLFTTPVIWNRKTRRRATMEQGKGIKKHLPASYHGYSTDDYLVFQEYGSDIDTILGATVALRDSSHQNFVFYSGKEPATISYLMKQVLKIAERRAERNAPVVK